MNFLTKWMTEKIGENMITKLWAALDGSKTYLLAGLGVVIALIGHFCGPVHVGPIDIPAITWEQVWSTLWTSGLFGALRLGISKNP